MTPIETPSINSWPVYFPSTRKPRVLYQILGAYDEKQHIRYWEQLGWNTLRHFTDRDKELGGTAAFQPLPSWLSSKTPVNQFFSGLFRSARPWQPYGDKEAMDISPLALHGWHPIDALSSVLRHLRLGWLGEMLVYICPNSSTAFLRLPNGVVTWRMHNV